MSVTKSESGGWKAHASTGTLVLTAESAVSYVKTEDPSASCHALFSTVYEADSVACPFVQVWSSSSPCPFLWI